MTNSDRSVVHEFLSRTSKKLQMVTNVFGKVLKPQPLIRSNSSKENDSFVISSSWSMWSPWSFCSNNIMVRVRACSTVRGFKCAGHNKEFQSCESSLVHPPTSLSRPEKPGETDDVDVVDPYTEDRRLAMRQLYQDYEVEVPENERTSPAPRTRPTAPAEPREPIVIAQYARRFPQPRGQEGVELASPGSRSSVDLYRKGSTALPTGSSSTSLPSTEATTQRKETPTTSEPLIDLSTEENFEGETTSNMRYDINLATLSITSREESIISSSESSVSNKTILQNEPSSTAQPIKYAKKSSSTTLKEELFQEFKDAAAVPAEDQFLSTMGLPGTTPKIPTKPTVATSSTTNSTISLPGAHSVYFGTTQTAVIVKGARFVGRAAHNPVRSMEPKVSRMPTLPPSQFHSASYEKESVKGKLSRQQRLKKLNGRAKVRQLAVSPTVNLTKEVSYRETHQELKKQMEALHKRIRKTKRKLAATLGTTMKPDSEEVTVEGDTARALSWMFANVAKMVDGKTDMPILDRVAVDKIDAETEQEWSRLPSGVEVISEQDQFILKEDASNDPVIKVDRQNAESTEISGMEWSDWTNCNCGAQSRKKLCVVSSRKDTDYQPRQRGSLRLCKSPEYETRPCHSTHCLLQ